MQRFGLTTIVHKLLFIITGLFVVACSGPQDRNNPVGRTTVLFHDDARRAWIGGDNRPLLTTIWYPAVKGTHESEWRIGVFRAGWTAQDADIADSDDRRPLIILSHGTGGAAAQLSWLAEHFASNGYLVAAVNHHGNTAAEENYLPQGFMLWWERAQDVSVVIDKLLADPRFGHRIDASRVGVAGFSLGGYTALSIAGARTDRSQWQRHCNNNPADPNCVLPPESPFTLADMERLLEQDDRVVASVARSGESYRDNRIRGAYAIAPMFGPAFDVKSLNDISIPLRIVVGDRDDQAVPEFNAVAVQAAARNAELQILPDVAHYTFLANCTFKGKLFVRELCKDPSGVDRRKIHQRIADDALVFFNQVFSRPDQTD